MIPPSDQAPAAPAAPAGQADDPEPNPRLAFPVVGIGASAGGLEAFTEFLTAVPAGTEMAFVLIQHLPPDRESLIAEILGRRCALPVRQISDGLALEAGQVYVIRPGATVTMPDGVFRLTEPAEPPGHRHPVDDFFASLAEVQRERSIAVVLSGMGSNGTAGARSIRGVGGLCLAQDPAAARFPSMPQSLVDSGLADLVLGAGEMPAAILRIVAQPGRDVPAATIAEKEAAVLREILQLLRGQVRHDFTDYKKPTLVRRITRRMGLKQVPTLADYRELLQREPAEAAALAEDLLIHITGFFRDPEAWEALRQQVLAPLAASRGEGSSLRAWVTACASGEEAYTLGILLLEAVAATGKHLEIKIFATDIAGRSLEHARTALYPAAIETDVSPDRLARFFEKADGGYRIKGELRGTVVFAPQNVLQDPPFSRLDLCTCRNLLIYLEPAVQKRVLRLMHFALREGGILLLGASETTGPADDLFEPVDRKHRIFRRLAHVPREPLEFSLGPSRTDGSPPEPGHPPPGASLMSLTHQALLSRHGPPAVVIDRSQRIVYFHGPTDRVLEQPRGEPTRDLLTLAREPVRGPLRRTVHEAIARDQPVHSGAFEADLPGGRRRLEIRAAPLETRAQPAYFLVSFEEPQESPAPGLAATPAPGPEGSAELERELVRIREELQFKIEELQVNNEEVKAAHEETISINEELQSSNEELETSKEELQSLNEELTTVNAQLQAKMEELEATTSDLSSLLSSTNIAVVFLDSQFRIRRYTPAVKDLLELIPTDVGRPLSHLALKFVDRALAGDAVEVLQTLAPIRQEVTSASGRTYIRAVQPYRTKEDRVDGVVLTFVDITERKEAEAALRESEEQHRLMFEGLQEYAVFMLDAAGVITTWSKAAERVLGYTRAEALGRRLALVLPPEPGQEAVAEAEIQDARRKGSTVQEGWRIRKDGSRFWATSALSAVLDSAGQLRGFVKVLRDNTERKLAEEDLRQAKRKAEAANEAKDQFLATVSHELRTPLSSIVLWANLIDENKPVDPAQLREVLAAIRHGAEEQRELIEDLVDTARIATGKLQLQVGRVDLLDVATAVALAQGAAAKAKGLRLEKEFGPGVGIVEADPLRLRQVMTNLLSNAVKFTPAGGRIHFSLRRDGDMVEMRVSDTGRGFAPEFAPRLFTRFEQVQSSGTRSHGGLGLGLSIAQQIVLLHRGTIEGQSPGPGQGATFVVRLPLPVSSDRTLPPPPPPPTGILPVLMGRNVLLVEDAADTRKALVAVLRAAGAAVTALEAASEALAEFSRRRPDLIISDLGLPGLDGYDLIREIRQREAAQRAPAVPALALTAFAGENDARRAVEGGFSRCLNKPIEPARLVDALAKLLPPD